MEDSIQIPSHSQRGREKRKYRISINNDHFDRNTYINGAEEGEEEELTVI